jgi:hypothetical protein
MIHTTVHSGVQRTGSSPSQMNIVHAIPLYVFKILFISILPSTLRSSKWLFSSDLTTKCHSSIKYFIEVLNSLERRRSIYIICTIFQKPIADIWCVGICEAKVLDKEACVSLSDRSELNEKRGIFPLQKSDQFIWVRYYIDLFWA